MAEYQYAICEDGYVRCCNCEAKEGHSHEEGCTGGSLLVVTSPTSAAPISLAEQRALKAEDNRLWTALDCAKAFVRDLESGKIKADAVAIHYYDKHEDGCRTLFNYTANLDREQVLALTVLAQNKALREWQNA